MSDTGIRDFADIRQGNTYEAVPVDHFMAELEELRIHYLGRKGAITACMRDMGKLSPEEREILVLRELEGFSGEETAKVLDLSLPGMKSRLHRARLRLAAVLVERNHG